MLKTFFNFLKSELNIELDSHQKSQMESFVVFYKKENEKINLSTITNDEEIIKKHLIDSVYLAKYQNLSPFLIADLGSGGGFPAIPLAIIFPKSTFHLFETRNKKVDFLNRTIKLLNLENVFVHKSRVEDVNTLGFRNHFNLVIARAFKPLNILVELALPYLKIGGKLCAYKGRNYLNEIDNAKEAILKVGGKLNRIEKYCLSEENDFRSFLFIDKIKDVNKYPRPYALIVHKPL